MTTKLFAFCLYFDRKRNRDLDLTCSRDIIDIPNTKILIITGHATSFSIFAFYFLCSESMTLKLLLTQLILFGIYFKREIRAKCKQSETADWYLWKKENISLTSLCTVLKLFIMFILWKYKCFKSATGLAWFHWYRASELNILAWFKKAKTTTY